MIPRGGGAGTYLDDGILALDARREGLLLDLNDEVARLEVARDAEGHVEVGNRLLPLVRQGGLLLGLLGAGSRLLGRRGF